MLAACVWLACSASNENAGPLDGDQVLSHVSFRALQRMECPRSSYLNLALFLRVLARQQAARNRHRAPRRFAMLLQTVMVARVLRTAIKGLSLCAAYCAYGKVSIPRQSRGL